MMMPICEGAHLDWTYNVIHKVAVSIPGKHNVNSYALSKFILGITNIGTGTWTYN